MLQFRRKNFTIRHTQKPVKREELTLSVRRNFTKLDHIKLLATAFSHMDSENSKLTIRVNELKELKTTFSKYVKQLKEKLLTVNDDIKEKMRVKDLSISTYLFETDTLNLHKKSKNNKSGKVHNVAKEKKKGA